MTNVASLPNTAPARVLACGAYLKNTACLIEDRRVIWSALHGDLGEAASCEALEASVDQLLAQASGPLQAVAHDLHPDFYSTRVALELADRLGVPAIAVQHHHAHIAVVHAEHAIAGPVIGLALDGVGLGTDGIAWGGEVLWVASSAAAHHWRRVDHLASLALPGGDVAARESWRMAAAVLHRLGRETEIEARFASAVGAPATRMVRSLLERGFNCPHSTSAGRWFDAAAGALGLCVRQGFEAEAAIVLEQQAREWLDTHPDFDVHWTSLDLAPLLAELFDMAGQDAASRARGAALFHLGLAAGLAYNAIDAARAHGARSIVLGGGCFANRVLTERLIARLQRAGLTVLQPESVGCGDAGLTLGQAWVAACTVSRDGAVAGSSTASALAA